MKNLIVGLCTILLLGCSLTSNQTGPTEPNITNDNQNNEVSQQVIEGDLIAEALEAETSTENPERERTVQATIGAQVFDLEVSDTQETREMGLMHREAIQYNEGMLFVFDIPAFHRFWMKNTLIPLDIIWLNEAKEVVHVETASPCYKEPCDVVGPETLSKYVIEVPAGSFVEEIGTVVEFSL